ncbi:aminoglycoside phosphotransferase family protein [Streptomyces sp. BK340]|uniref:aminoglycoside phosphotransferase family protein n=1 Tax=Streptomyces sp. BK340 TaxID=2572903 RepID=UPI0011A588EF|nr:aminoglycoside phosphotransferase family protein [Streptomyces sp. BK340]TVZ91667.1 aminoglycoside phosphotransferase (APT) family kinase protein [Streptomyces sp. BK340]
MCAVKMHEDEVEIDAALVGRMIARQFPAWASLPVRRLKSSGTENAMFRLGTELVVRLPRRPGAVPDVVHEQRWLPLLGARVPVATPEPVGLGEPGEGFPWPWSVYRWLEGRNPVAGAVEAPERLAEELGAFVAALRRTGLGDGPSAGRGVPLANRDEPTRAALAQLTGRIDTAPVTALWERALSAPAHAGPPAWMHGDLSPGNVLVADGRLSAVIDFGCAGTGDPAVDLIVAWNLLPATARDTFRKTVGADDAEWARGRGWALSISLIQLPYYWHTNPALAENSRHVIAEILAEAG